ncbi:MAG TPA: 4'-phosphopantetheinyl transferase superfamily protein [Longimicrobiales bacterium]|nr:4'-phosphopantetheinyl transferase superfamily protein [Longimicrobiales bacterium]
MRRPRAAPRVVSATGGSDEPPRVSITHSGGCAAAAAVPSGWLVGIDMERAGSVDDSETRFFLSRRERLELDRFDATTLWCLKEAAWKALECDGTVAFKELELRFGADGGLHVVRMKDRAWRARARVLRIRGKWIVAVVRVREYVLNPLRGAAS